MAKTKVIEENRSPENFYSGSGGLKATMGTCWTNGDFAVSEERPVIQTITVTADLVKDPNGREKCVSCQLCELFVAEGVRLTGEIDAELEPERAHVERHLSL